MWGGEGVEFHSRITLQITIFLLTCVHELTICTFSITKSTVEDYSKQNSVKNRHFNLDFHTFFSKK